MSDRNLEYLIDRKNQEISDLKKELRELHDECKSGAWFMFFAGNFLGFVIGRILM